MKSLLAAAIAAASVGSHPAPAPQSAKPIQLATVCFKTGENAPQGSMTKICFYDCLGSEVAITIRNIALCPLSINR